MLSAPFNFLFTLIHSFTHCVGVRLCVCVCVCVCTRATVSICMSEDNFKEFVLTVGTEDAMQVVRLGGKCP